MSEFIYGHWRGQPAREIRTTGERQWYQVTNRDTYEGHWSTLAWGYCTEFKPWPDQIDCDQWSQLHHP